MDGSLLMLLIVIAVFYFVAIRPQRKRVQEHQALLKSLEPGDEVVTIGGLCGFINRVDDDFVFLEVSDGVEIRFSRQSVNKKIEGGDGQLSDHAEEDAEEDAGEPAASDGAKTDD